MLHLRADGDGHDAGRTPRALDVELRHARVGMGRAEERHVQAPARPEVVNVAPGAHEEAMVLAPLEGPADPAVARVSVGSCHEDAW